RRRHTRSTRDWSSDVCSSDLGKLDMIVTTLREKRKKFKNLIADAKGFKLRTLNDPDGDCATICTVIFDNRGQALKVSKILGSKRSEERRVGKEWREKEKRIE